MPFFRKSIAEYHGWYHFIIELLIVALNLHNVKVDCAFVYVLLSFKNVQWEMLYSYLNGPILLINPHFTHLGILFESFSLSLSLICFFFTFSCCFTPIDSVFS